MFYSQCVPISPALGVEGFCCTLGVAEEGQVGFSNSWCFSHASPRHLTLIQREEEGKGGGERARERASTHRDTPVTKPHWKAYG